MKENQARIISLEKSKALKRIKELKGNEQSESSNKGKMQNENSKIIDERTAMSLDIRNTSDGFNPFNENSLQDSNPFLNSPVDTDYNSPFGVEGTI